MGNFLDSLLTFWGRSIHRPNQFPFLTDFLWLPFRLYAWFFLCLVSYFRRVPISLPNWESPAISSETGSQIFSALSALISIPEFSITRYSVDDFSLYVKFCWAVRKTITKSFRPFCAHLVLTWVFLGFNFVNFSSCSCNSSFIFTLSSRPLTASGFLKFSTSHPITIMHFQ